MPTMDEIMGDIFLGAYATEQEALDAMAARAESPEQMVIVNDNVDPDHPWRIKWIRPD